MGKFHLVHKDDGEARFVSEPVRRGWSEQPLIAYWGRMNI